MFLMLRDPLLSAFAAKVARARQLKNKVISFMLSEIQHRVRGPERRTGAPETHGEA